MKKIFDVFLRLFTLVLVLVVVFSGGYFIGNYETIITDKFVLPKLVRVIEENSLQFNESFVVDSEDDLLYTNLRATLDQSYHYSGVSDVKVEITDYNLFSKGNNQCSYIPVSEENDFNLKCKKEEDKLFVNYIVELEVSYIEDEIPLVRNEKGLVVFIKINGKLDLFNWRLVRFNRIILND